MYLCRLDEDPDESRDAKLEMQITTDYEEPGGNRVEVGRAIKAKKRRRSQENETIVFPKEKSKES
jgi:hypothetical protein